MRRHPAGGSTLPGHPEQAFAQTTNSLQSAATRRRERPMVLSLTGVALALNRLQRWRRRVGSHADELCEEGPW